jgi:hypothetical protein
VERGALKELVLSVSTEERREGLEGGMRNHTRATAQACELVRVWFS